MSKRLYTFLKNNDAIYNLPFGFKQQYSSSHALVNITENIRKALDDENMLFIITYTSTNYTKLTK